MKVLIVGAGVVNKGAETMLRTVQTELKKRIDNISFYIEKSCISGGTEDQIEDLGIIIIERRTPHKLIRWFEFLLPVFFLPNLASQILSQKKVFKGWMNLIQGMDAIIDISGYRYGETWGVKAAILALPASFYAWIFHKPYLFLPQAWGPFDQKTKVYRLCRWMTQRGKLVFARDAQSQDYLSKLLSTPKEKILLSPDIAFSFKPSINDEGISSLFQKMRSNSNYVVGVIPNMRVYERAEGQGSENYYVKTILDTCRFLMNEGNSIILLPHEINPKENAKDDRFLCELISDKLNNRDRLFVINQVVSSEYIKDIISHCDLIISSRFHAVVASLELCKPTIVIGWSHKYEELMSDVGLGDYVADYRADSTYIIQLTQNALNNSGLISGNLSALMPQIKRKVKEVFDKVASILSNC